MMARRNSWILDCCILLFTVSLTAKVVLCGLCPYCDKELMNEACTNGIYEECSFDQDYVCASEHFMALNGTYVSKRCMSKSDCESFDNNCSRSDGLYDDEEVCRYCCTGDLFNRDPDSESPKHTEKRCRFGEFFSMGNCTLLHIELPFILHDESWIACNERNMLLYEPSNMTAVT